MSRLIASLNDAQRAAVTAPAGHLLVLAGAGSGKTRVLVHRIAWLVEVEGYAPHSILAVTFTNKAAREMQGRISDLLERPLGGLWSGTFHGLSHRLLRQFHLQAGLPAAFQVLDSGDQARAIKRVLRDLDLDEARWPVKVAQAYINARKEEGLRADRIEPGRDPVSRQWVRVYTAYEALCQRTGSVDFAELLLRSCELLERNAEVADFVKQRFQHILVDEFQDTNALQYRWLRRIAGQHALVFAVGDDDQSIYGWRGARVEHLADYLRDFRVPETIRLEQNYRSTKTILAAANSLIANNVDRLGKTLWSAGEDGPPIRILRAIDEHDEARFVVGRIENHVASGGALRDCAVLYRSNAQSRVLEEALVTSGVPYRVYGGLRFFDRQEVRDALAYLRLARNPEDDAAFLRVINLPARGIGEKTQDELRGLAAEGGLSLMAIAREMVVRGALPARARGALKTFLETIERIRKALDGELPDAIATAIDASGLRDHYRADRAGRSEDRLENLDELINAGRTFALEHSRVRALNGNENDPPSATNSRSADLDAFLAAAALDAGEEEAGAFEDAVQLMTLHAAKGLEFPVVFIVGMEDGLFPNARALDEPGRLDEERRLAYVGVTRAEHQLYLCHAERRTLWGKPSFAVPSRFLDELPESLCEQLRPRRSMGAVGRSTTSDSTRSGRFGAVSQSANPFSPGSRWRHARFGEGTVLACEGDGDQARVHIRFSEHGEKWLIAGFAKLERVA